MEELNKIANDTANDIEKLLDEKRRRYRVLMRVDHVQGQHPTQVRGKRNVKRED